MEQIHGILLRLLELVPEIQYKLRIHLIIESGHGGLVIYGEFPYIILVCHPLKHICTSPTGLPIGIQVLRVSGLLGHGLAPFQQQLAVLTNIKTPLFGSNCVR